MDMMFGIVKIRSVSAANWGSDGRLMRCAVRCFDLAGSDVTCESYNDLQSLHAYN